MGWESYNFAWHGGPHLARLQSQHERVKVIGQVGFVVLMAHLSCVVMPLFPVGCPRPTLE